MNTKSKLRSALLALLTISFITVFSTGCGDSREDFVLTNNNAVNTGNLVFRFARATAQTVDIVPASTAQIRIDLYSSTTTKNASTFVDGGLFNFAEVITFEGAADIAVCAVVTTFDADGLPTATLTGPVTVIPGETNDADVGDAVTVTFDTLAVTPDPINLVVGGDNPDTDQQQLVLTGTISGSPFQLPINADVATFQLGNDDLANVSADGVISTTFLVGTRIPQGNTTLTTTYTFLGFQQQDTVDVRVFFFLAVSAQEPEVPQGGAYNDGFGAQFFGADGIRRDTAGNLSFSLESPQTGISIDSTTGVITATGDATIGSDFNVIVSFTDANSGVTVTDTILFTVVAPQIP